MPPTNIENQPVTFRTIAAVGGAAVTLIGLVISGVVAFDHVVDRCDLLDQRLATLTIERNEYRAARDVQIAALNARCDALDRNVVDLEHGIADVEKQLAVIASRQDDTLIALKRIDQKVDAGRP